MRRLRVISVAGALILFAIWLTASAWTQAQSATAQKVGEDEKQTEENQVHDPILTDLQQRLAQMFQQEHLPARLSFEDAALIANYHTRHEKVHLRFKSNLPRESPRLTDVVVPAQDGIYMVLQVEDGKYVGQSVRPQQLHTTYHTQAGKVIGWTTYLDQFWFKKANKTLLLSLAYNNQTSPHQIDKIIAPVRAYATSQGATEGQYMP